MGYHGELEVLDYAAQRDLTGCGPVLQRVVSQKSRLFSP